MKNTTSFSPEIIRKNFSRFRYWGFFLSPTTEFILFVHQTLPPSLPARILNGYVIDDNKKVINIYNVNISYTTYIIFYISFLTLKGLRHIIRGSSERVVEIRAYLALDSGGFVFVFVRIHSPNQ